MKVELKNVKHAEFASHETHCFTASIYIDGKRAGEVSNEGQGGSNRLRFNNSKLYVAFCKYARSLPPLPPDKKLGSTEPLPYDEELLIGDLLEKHLMAKKFKRHFKTKTLFRLKGDKEDAYRTVNSPFSDKVKEYLTNTYGEKIEMIANEVYG